MHVLRHPSFNEDFIFKLPNIVMITEHRFGGNFRNLTNQEDFLCTVSLFNGASEDDF